MNDIERVRAYCEAQGWEILDPIYLSFPEREVIPKDIPTYFYREISDLYTDRIVKFKREWFERTELLINGNSYWVYKKKTHSLP